MRIDFNYKLQANKIGSDGKPTGEVVTEGLLPLGFLVLQRARNGYVAVSTFSVNDNNLAIAISRAFNQGDKQFLEGRTVLQTGATSGFKARVLEEVNSLPLDTGSEALCAVQLVASIIEQAPGIRCDLEGKPQQFDKVLEQVKNTVPEEDVSKLENTKD